MWPDTTDDDLMRVTCVRRNFNRKKGTSVSTIVRPRGVKRLKHHFGSKEQESGVCMWCMCDFDFMMMIISSLLLNFVCMSCSNIVPSCHSLSPPACRTFQTTSSASQKKEPSFVWRSRVQSLPQQKKSCFVKVETAPPFCAFKDMRQ